MPYTNAPYWALTMTVIIVVMIMPLRHFKTILGVDMDLYCIALLLEIGAFIRLRYAQPDRPRAYRVPVEGVWMWLLFFPMVVITVAGIVLGGWLESMVMIAFIFAGLVVLIVLHVLRGARPEWFVVAEGVTDVMSDAAKGQPDTPQPPA